MLRDNQKQLMYMRIPKVMQPRRRVKLHTRKDKALPLLGPLLMQKALVLKPPDKDPTLKVILKLARALMVEPLKLMESLRR